MESKASKNVSLDSKRYFMFTKPQRVTTAMHSLEGLLKGIAMDGDITANEVLTLKTWLEKPRKNWMARSATIIYASVELLEIRTVI